jgi:hypothetical protein
MTTKTDPIPVRFDRSEKSDMAAIEKKTGLSRAEIIRRACRFAFPRFLKGKVQIVNYPAKGISDAPKPSPSAAAK